ncbi:tRNA pseudouridine synthase A, mitochondrial-like [Ananas comosus]|uniref:tRNA pseudouridine synthase A, mitochondrial-like n=1 Tax=Ananas comosus TaxID=4615 RepID=A0A6P5ENA3_ANACO|nr:tRNA pseudouridine synthase A, mitochondrial-like [Ananas comosus]
MASPPSSPPSPKKLKMSSSTSEADPDADASAAASGEPRRRYKRRKVAIFLGYCGAGYQGMQKNPGARTIEGDLEEALFLAGAVPDADRGAPRRYDWARSARTDKGVSAAAQVVSGRFYIDPPGLVARLSAHLPDQIRIFGYKRVTNSFNAKKFCDRRRYVYLLPVFALDPSAHPDREAVMASLGSGNELARCVECSERGRKVPGIMGRGPKGSNGGEKSKLCGGETGGDENGVSNLNLTSVVSACEERNDACKSELECSNTEKPEHGSEQGGGEDDGASNLNSMSSVLQPEKEREVGNGGFESREGEESCGNSRADSVSKHGTLGSEELAADEKSKLVEGRLTEEETAKGGVVESTANEEAVLAIKSGFCYGDEEKERFNRILKHYVGTHNFHNFTTRTKAEDPSARRYIISFEADRVVTIDGIDFVKCEVVGQSFMLHQIRKMIGLAVAVMRNCAPESLMEVALKKEVSINVPTAPEVGLYLDECLFSSYNKKWRDSHEEISMASYAEEAEEFRMKHIYPHIAQMEHKEGAVALWLHSLNLRNYPDFHFVDTNSESLGAEQTKQDNLGQ